MRAAVVLLLSARNVLGFSSLPTGGTETLDPSEILCNTGQANAQSPRNVTRGSPGEVDTPLVYTPTGAFNNAAMDPANLHFHLGAEHYSGGQYDVDFDYGKPPGSTDEETPGRMCSIPMLKAKFGLTDAQVDTPYAFQYCRGETRVGSTYEFHYVHSTGADHVPGYSEHLSDGLGGAFDFTINPLVLVQAQVFVLINDASGRFDQYNWLNPDEASAFSLRHGWNESLAAEDSAFYLGSTTGTKYGAEICSMYLAQWEVDRMCHVASAQSMDKLCQWLESSGDETVDVKPHGARAVVMPVNASKALYNLPDVRKGHTAFECIASGRDDCPCT